MKLIHTSDWHLGADLHGHNRLREQQQFLLWLGSVCIKNSIDALLVSGDIYDTVNPPVAAQRMLTDFIAHLREELPQCQIIITAGNHDSAGRLEILQPLARALGGIHIIGSIDAADLHCLQNAVIPLKINSQELQHQDTQAFPGDGSNFVRQKNPAEAICLAVPFLRTSDLHCKVQDNESNADAWEREVGALYHNLKEIARKQFGNLPLIGMGHLTIRHSQRSNSEHMLIGGIESVDSSALADGLDYLALGHLHRAQKSGGDHIRYCGSPLAMDFDERNYNHQVLLLNISHAQPESMQSSQQSAPEPVCLDIQSIPVPAPVPFFRLPEKPGTWQDLQSAVESLPWDQFAELEDDLHPFVQLEILQSEIPGDLRRMTEELLQGKPVRLVGSTRIHAATQEEQEIPEPVKHIDLGDQQTPIRLFQEQWEKKYQSTCPESIDRKFSEVCAQVRRSGGF